MAKITISDLHGYLLDERNLGRLGDIPGYLYEDVSAEMDRLYQEADTLHDRFSERVSAIMKERESLREYLQSLYSLRTKKILAMALAASNGEVIDRTQLRYMVAGERELYEVIYSSCVSCRKALLDRKQIIEVTAYNYAAPEHPEETTASPVSPEIPAELEDISGAEEIIEPEIPEPSSVESEACHADPAPDRNCVVAVRSPISEFQDMSGRIYSLSPGDVVSLPATMADILCKDNKALSIRIR